MIEIVYCRCVRKQAQLARDRLVAAGFQVEMRAVLRPLYLVIKAGATTIWSRGFGKPLPSQEALGEMARQAILGR